MQDVSRYSVLVAGVPDAKTDAAIAFAKVGMDRPQAVVPRMTTALFDAGLARGKVQLVMENGDVCGCDLVKRSRRLHRLAGQVHECLGLQQDDLLRAEPPFGHLTVIRFAPRPEPVVDRDPVNRHKADVVPVARVFRARIAKAHEKLHLMLLFVDLTFAQSRGVVQALDTGVGVQHRDRCRQRGDLVRYTVVCSMRNEGPFIVEWVTWYRMLGFTDIVVVTNDCTDHSPPLLDALAAAGWVTHLVRDVPDARRICAVKLDAAKALPQVAGADWVMVCDVDEFLVIHLGDGRIGDLIGSVTPGFLGMSISWRVFGTGGAQTWQDGLTHRQFTRAAPLRHGLASWIKSIHAHPGWFWRLGEHGPKNLRARHADAWGKPGMRWVNADGVDVDEWQPRGAYLRWLRPDLRSWASAQINHYMLRSVESFGLKRGTLSSVAGVDRYTDKYFTNCNRNEEEDLSALRHAAEFDALHAQAMALPGVARLHHLCCADYVARLAEKAGRDVADDPRWHYHAAQADG